MEALASGLYSTVIKNPQNIPLWINGKFCAGKRIIYRNHKDKWVECIGAGPELSFFRMIQGRPLFNDIFLIISFAVKGSCKLMQTFSCQLS